MGEENCTVLEAYLSSNTLRSYSIIEVSFVCLLLCGSLTAWFFAKDYKQLAYLRNRNSASVILFSLALISLLLYSAAARIPNEYSKFVSCAVGNSTFLAFPPLFLMGLLVEVFSFGFKAKLRFRLVDEEIQTSTISRLLWFTDTPAFSNILAVISFCIVLAISLGASAVTCPEFGATKCKNIDARDYKTLLIFFILALVAAAQTVYIYRKLLTFPDPFNILVDIRRMTLATFFAVLFMILLFRLVVDDAYGNTSIKFSPTVVGNLPFYSIYIYLVPYQVYKAFRLQSAGEVFKHFDLAEILDDITGHALLKQYLIYEFSVENLLFLEAVDALVNIHDPSHKIAHLRVIYDEFISNRRLNLSSASYTYLDSIFKGNKQEYINTYVFQAAYREIFVLIEFDAFSRFKKSNQFKVYVGLNKVEISI